MFKILLCCLAAVAIDQLRRPEPFPVMTVNDWAAHGLVESESPDLLGFRRSFMDIEEIRIPKNDARLQQWTAHTGQVIEMRIRTGGPAKMARVERVVVSGPIAVDSDGDFYVLRQVRVEVQ